MSRLRGTQQDVTSRTRPHRRVERLLDTLQLNYETEYTEFRPYALDLYLPEWHLAVEVDGPTHSKAKDKRRDDTLLERYGVLVLHVPVDLSPEHVEVQVMAFIRKHAGTAKERRRKIAWDGA